MLDEKLLSHWELERQKNVDEKEQSAVLFCNRLIRMQEERQMKLQRCQQ